jgi:hypothetical protein
MDFLVRQFWPDEKRFMSDEEIVASILEKNPDVIIARKGYISKQRNNILTLMLRDPKILSKYPARYLLNNREIVFERTENNAALHRSPNAAVIAPAGATVKTITEFHWCDNDPCYTTQP